MARRRQRQSAAPETPSDEVAETPGAGGRALWTGQIRLSLVAVPVRLHAAVRSSSPTPISKASFPSATTVPARCSCGTPAHGRRSTIREPASRAAICASRCTANVCRAAGHSCRMGPARAKEAWLLVKADDAAADATRDVDARTLRRRDPWTAWEDHRRPLRTAALRALGVEWR